MTYDLHDFLNKYREQFPDSVWEIEYPLSIKYEMTAFAQLLDSQSDPPILLFKNVNGYSQNVVSNVFASTQRLAYILGIKPDNLVTSWSEISRRRIKPLPVIDAPIKENIKLGSEINLFEFPIPIHYENDAGRYITSGVIIAKDPFSGIGNMSFARLLVKDKSWMGISLHSRGDLWKYQQLQEALNKPLEIAVAIGVHPAISIAAATQLPYNEDEMELAGGLLGSAVEVIKAETVDLYIPARAEMIIEGYIEPKVMVDEGPFGEFTGYASDRSTHNSFRITAITHRNEMLYQDIVPGYSLEHLNLSKISRVPRVYDTLKRNFNNIVNIHYPYSGTHFHCYVSLHDPLPGQAKQIISMLFGLDMYLKLVIVVDDDIDVKNEKEVLWALATRFQADRDLVLINGVLCNLLDPSSENGLSAKLGLDATLSRGKRIQRTTIPSEVIERISKLINNSK